MLRVYLDQNKWIDLARARTGNSRGADFVAVYRAARAAAASGTASFPLSAAHYYETHKQRDPLRRGELAMTMLEISRLDAIAPPHTIVPWEIERALIEEFGLAHRRPELAIFGWGADHVFATDAFGFTTPEVYEGYVIPARLREALATRGRALFEYYMLSDTGISGEQHQYQRIEIHKHMRLTGDKFVDGQNDVRDRLPALGHHRLQDLMIATAFMDIIEPITQTAGCLGVDLSDVLDRDRESLRTLLTKIPSRWVEMQLRRVRQSNPQQPWSSHDLNDVTALSIAVPYCDIVVTERSWTSMLNTNKISSSYGTVVINDVRDLPSLLSQAAAS